MANDETFIPRAFSNVDSGEAQSMVAYLDRITEVTREAKRAGYASLSIGRGARVLDVGCGAGDDVRMLAELVGSDGFVDGVDSSEAMIGAAKERGLPANTRVQVASAYELPFQRETFDAVRSERVFQHLDDPQRAADELFRVVKPGGVAMLLDQDWDTLVVTGSERELTRRIVHTMCDSVANGWAGRTQRTTVQTSGFVEIQTIGRAVALPYQAAVALIFQPAIRFGIESGRLDGEIANRFFGDIAAAQERNEFFCAFTYFESVGRKPVT